MNFKSDSNSAFKVVEYLEDYTYKIYVLVLKIKNNCDQVEIFWFEKEKSSRSVLDISMQRVFLTLTLQKNKENIEMQVNSHAVEIWSQCFLSLKFFGNFQFSGNYPYNNFDT